MNKDISLTLLTLKKMSNRVSFMSFLDVYSNVLAVVQNQSFYEAVYQLYSIFMLLPLEY